MNCLLSVPGYSDFEVICFSISHGIEVISGAPDSTRDFRAFYISKRASNRFLLGIVFTTNERYASFGSWMRGFGKQASTPNNPVGTVRVMIPARNFDRIGVPVRGTTFGAEVGESSHRIMLEFDGAFEVGDLKDLVPSTFENPKVDSENGRFFYPAGVQLSGPGAAEDSLYGLPTGTTLMQNGLNKIAALFGGGGQPPPPSSPPPSSRITVLGVDGS